MDATTRVIAVDIPKNQNANAPPWYDYRTSVDRIEAAKQIEAAFMVDDMRVVAGSRKRRE